MRGQITNIRNVKIQKESSGLVGGIGGAVIGAALGSTIGGGSGRDVAMALGGVGGTVAGTGIEKKLNSVSALEIEVKLDNGNTVVITQQPGNERFQIGDAVRVVTSAKGTSRVTH